MPGNLTNKRYHVGSRGAVSRKWPAFVFELNIPLALRLSHKDKGKCHPCTGTEALSGRTAHRGSRGIAVLYRH